ncbi:MAG TPA: hypothetical protein VFN78_07450 [Ktedonobacterales bacterium]|nr:hypothetical protein [Ktedonobacterales bacterium]
MEKLYRALVWLAGIGLVCGLFVAFMFQTPASNTSIQGPSSFGVSGFAPTFFSVLMGSWFMELMRLSSVLTDGATVLGIVAAWVGRRRGWLVALLVVTLLTWLWPTAVQAWQVAIYVPQTAGDGPSPQTIYDTNLSMFAVPLIPVVMALILALTNRKLIPTVTTSTDAELGIVRSAL